MRHHLMIALVASLMVTSCSQPATNARSYQYGGILSAGGSLGLHTMRKGDTLWSVAKAYNVDLRDMLDINKLSVPYRVGVGQRIKIPAPLNYAVKKGDTLYNVSRMFDTTTTDLAQLNNIKAPFKLRTGQSLRLPPRHKPTNEVMQVYAQQVPPVTKEASASSRIEREELKAAQVPREEAVSLSSKSVSSKKSSELASARMAPQALTGNVNFIKPVAGQIISGYGPKEDGLHNDGINIKAAKGDVVRAAERGVVVYQGNQIGGYGNMILIRHAGGYLTAYAHMAKILVHKGDSVSRGQSIGTVGASGSVKSPQLHFEIRKGRDAVDPKMLIRI